jgi:hypothetical protein
MQLDRNVFGVLICNICLNNTKTVYKPLLKTNCLCVNINFGNDLMCRGYMIVKPMPLPAAVVADTEEVAHNIDHKYCERIGKPPLKQYGERYGERRVRRGTYSLLARFSVGAYCASQVLDRGAQGVVRGAARCAPLVLGRGA